MWLGAGDPFAPGTKGQLVQELTQSVTGVVTAKDGNVFGETTVFIDGRRSEVRTQETTAGNLSADANLFIARQVDPGVQVSIKNGGGIRAEIGEVVNNGDVTELLPPQANTVSGKLEGQISQLDIENSLRFNNGLTVLTTTAAGLKELLEHGVAATAPGVTPGQFPQIGGMAFSFDPSLPARTATTPGERVRSLVVGIGVTADVVVANGEIVGNPDRPIKVVTLGFLAGGGDSYPFPAVTVPGSQMELNASNVPAGVATFATAGSEQDAFAEYLAAFFGIGAGTPFSTADTTPAEDTRIQNVSARADSLVKTATTGNDFVFGTNGDDRLFGLAGNDRIFGLSGNDIVNGGEGNDFLLGGNGDDALTGGPGFDTYIGGGGSDTYIVGEGGDLVIGFDKRRDTIDFGGAFASESDFKRATRRWFGSTLVNIPGGAHVVVQGAKPSDLVVGGNVTL